MEDANYELAFLTHFTSITFASEIEYLATVNLILSNGNELDGGRYIPECSQTECELCLFGYWLTLSNSLCDLIDVSGKGKLIQRRERLMHFD